MVSCSVAFNTLVASRAAVARGDVQAAARAEELRTEWAGNLTSSTAPSLASICDSPLRLAPACNKSTISGCTSTAQIFPPGVTAGAMRRDSLEADLYLPANAKKLPEIVSDTLDPKKMEGIIIDDEDAELVGTTLQQARATELERPFAALTAQGIGLWIGVQAIINMGVNMGVLPTKGLTLPLLSFGGSAILATCCALAILLRVDWENRQLSRGFTV